MIKIDDSYLEDEIRDGFYIPSMTKRTWAMELTVLDLIDEICKKHSITYFADWGTYLGAVRHAGFVPWDDDMDICMHRNEFEKFRSVAEKELPDGYSIMSFHNNDYSWKFIYNIVPNDHMCFEPEYLKTHYSFPYIVAIDIFIIDNISDDSSLEQKRNDKIKSLLYEADKLDAYENSNTDSDKINEKKRSLYSEAEELLRIENINDTKCVVQKIPWGVYDNRSYPKEEFMETVRIPFEMTTVPVPLKYNHILSTKYGDFMEIHVGGGGHDYPYYAGQKKALGEEFDYPRSYRFSKDDILECEKDYSASLKVIALDMKDYLNDSIDILKEITKCCNYEEKNVEEGNYSKEDIANYLSDLQQNMISFGTLIESVKGEGTETVSDLEKYCEILFKVAEVFTGTHQTDGIDTESYISELILKLANTVASVNHNVDVEVINRRSVLFLPVKGKYWDSLKAFYEKEKLSQNTDVFVMPLPYFYKEYDSSFKSEVNCDADEFAALGITICQYDQFDISLLCPDKIYINMPYDEYNMTMSVPATFYARNIRKYTEKLIYIPFFKSMEFDKLNYPCWHNMQYYCCVPGVVMADEVIVQSENTRLMYIEKLNEWVGNDKYTEVWESKLVCFTNECINIDSANIVATNEKKANIEVADNNVIHSKKTLLWYISTGSVVEYGNKYFEKAYSNLEIFDSNKDNLWVVLASDSFIDDVLKTNYPNLYYMWAKFIDDFRNKNIGETADISIELSDLRKKAILCDAYYGDPSVICKDLIFIKKPVMLQNVEI